MPARETVVLLHGIFRTHRSMRKLSVYLSSEGFDVLNLDYPSTKEPLEKLAEGVWRNILERADHDKPLHFVGFSMGGLLVRALLNIYRPEHLGRVVLLATPNKGSEVADFIKNFWLYRRLYGPAGQQLITVQTEIGRQLGSIDYECGVLAGNRSIDPISSLLIKGKDDGKVSIENTKIEGMKDHMVLPSPHTWFAGNPAVMKQTGYFLRNGMFFRD